MPIARPPFELSAAPANFDSAKPAYGPDRASSHPAPSHPAPSLPAPSHPAPSHPHCTPTVRAARERDATGGAEPRLGTAGRLRSAPLPQMAGGLPAEARPGAVGTRGSAIPHRVQNGLPPTLGARESGVPRLAAHSRAALQSAHNFRSMQASLTGTYCPSTAQRAQRHVDTAGPPTEPHGSSASQDSTEEEDGEVCAVPPSDITRQHARLLPNGCCLCPYMPCSQVFSQSEIVQHMRHCSGSIAFTDMHWAAAQELADIAASGLIVEPAAAAAQGAKPPVAKAVPGWPPLSRSQARIPQPSTAPVARPSFRSVPLSGPPLTSTPDGTAYVPEHYAGRSFPKGSPITAPTAEPQFAAPQCVERTFDASRAAPSPADGPYPPSSSSLESALGASGQPLRNNPGNRTQPQPGSSADHSRLDAEPHDRPGGCNATVSFRATTISSGGLPAVEPVQRSITIARGDSRPHTDAPVLKDRRGEHNETVLARLEHRVRSTFEFGSTGGIMCPGCKGAFMQRDFGTHVCACPSVPALSGQMKKAIRAISTLTENGRFIVHNAAIPGFSVGATGVKCATIPEAVKPEKTGHNLASKTTSLAQPSASSGELQGDALSKSKNGGVSYGSAGGGDGTIAGGGLGSSHAQSVVTTSPTDLKPLPTNGPTGDAWNPPQPGSEVGATATVSRNEKEAHTEPELEPGTVSEAPKAELSLANGVPLPKPTPPPSEAFVSAENSKVTSTPDMPESGIQGNACASSASSTVLPEQSQAGESSDHATLSTAQSASPNAKSTWEPDPVLGYVITALPGEKCLCPVPGCGATLGAMQLARHVTSRACPAGRKAYTLSPEQLEALRYFRQQGSRAYEDRKRGFPRSHPQGAICPHSEHCEIADGLHFCPIGAGLRHCPVPGCSMQTALANLEDLRRHLNSPSCIAAPGRGAPLSAEQVRTVRGFIARWAWKQASLESVPAATPETVAAVEKSDKCSAAKAPEGPGSGTPDDGGHGGFDITVLPGNRCRCPVPNCRVEIGGVQLVRHVNSMNCPAGRREHVLSAAERNSVRAFRAAALRRYNESRRIDALPEQRAAVSGEDPRRPDNGVAGAASSDGAQTGEAEVSSEAQSNEQLQRSVAHLKPEGFEVKLLPKLRCLCPSCGKEMNQTSLLRHYRVHEKDTDEKTRPTAAQTTYVAELVTRAYAMRNAKKRLSSTRSPGDTRTRTSEPQDISQTSPAQSNQTPSPRVKEPVEDRPTPRTNKKDTPLREGRVRGSTTKSSTDAKQSSEDIVLFVPRLAHGMTICPAKGCRKRVLQLFLARHMTANSASPCAALYRSAPGLQAEVDRVAESARATYERVEAEALLEHYDLSVFDPAHSGYDAAKHLPVEQSTPAVPVPDNVAQDNGSAQELAYRKQLSDAHSINPPPRKRRRLLANCGEGCCCPIWTCTIAQCKLELRTCMIDQHITSGDCGRSDHPEDEAHSALRTKLDTELAQLEARRQELLRERRTLYNST